MKLITLEGVSDSAEDSPVAAYHSLGIGNDEMAWFELTPAEAQMMAGGWGTPKKQKPEPK